MKNLKRKFESKIKFVKPLYKKVTSRKTVPIKHSHICIDIDNNTKLHGNGFDVERHTKLNNNVISNEKTAITLLPGACERISKKKYEINNENTKDNKNMFFVSETTRDVSTQSRGLTGPWPPKHKVLDSWIRVYPAPCLPGEKLTHILFRCFMCQLGLATFLLLWTLAWVVAINRFEEPYEAKVSRDFLRQQNQLVIDLATELRQITPVSPKWRSAIEARLHEERQMTIAAVGRGARLHPGHYWDLAGTFLFTVYVMTAFGFGAPVPQTVWGRTASLIYAVIAVPLHIFLMVNMSTCTVIQLENCGRRLLQYISVNRQPRRSTDTNKSTKIENHTNRCSTETQSKSNCIRKKIACMLKVAFVGRGVPLATLLYYMLGALSFGVARAKPTLDTVMFPLEFTTSGGLEHITHFVRVLYGLYIEGAMVLLSSALASLRRHNSGTVDRMNAKYRLFVTEDIKDT